MSWNYMDWSALLAVSANAQHTFRYNFVAVLRRVCAICRRKRLLFLIHMLVYTLV